MSDALEKKMLTDKEIMTEILTELVSIMNEIGLANIEGVFGNKFVMIEHIEKQDDEGIQ